MIKTMLFAIFGAFLFVELPAEAQEKSDDRSSYCQRILAMDPGLVARNGYSASERLCQSHPSFDPSKIDYGKTSLNTEPASVSATGTICNSSTSTILSFSVAEPAGAGHQVRGYYNKNPGECLVWEMGYHNKIWVAARPYDRNEYFENDATARICISSKNMAFDLLQMPKQECPEGSVPREAYEVSAGGTRNFTWNKSSMSEPATGGLSEAETDLLIVGGGLAALIAALSGPDEDEKCMRNCQRNKSKSECGRICSVD